MACVNFPMEVIEDRSAVQISCGILSIGLGVIFAVSFRIDDMLLTLFRVPIISGVMFLVAGFLSVMLYRNPGLLQMCFHANIFCLVVAAIGEVLLFVDLKQSVNLQLSVEILVLCVMLLDMMVSVVLIFFINAEKRRQVKEVTPLHH